MRVTVVILLAGSLMGGVASGARSHDIKGVVDRWMWYPSECNPEAIGAHEREEVIAELQSRLPTNGPDRGVATRLLVRLGDRTTILHCIDIVRNPSKAGPRLTGYANAALEQCTEPWVIPILAEDLALPITAVDPFSGMGVESRPVNAALVIRALLTRSSAFTPTVRESAQGFRASGFPQLRDGFLAWWQQNKEAFARQDYVAVKPLQPVSGPGAALPPRSTPHSPTNAPSVVAATVDAPAPRPSPVPGGERSVPDGAQAARPAPEPDGARPGDAPPTARSPWPMVGAGVVLLGLAVLGILALRRRHRD